MCPFQVLCQAGHLLHSLKCSRPMSGWTRCFYCWSTPLWPPHCLLGILFFLVENLYLWDSFSFPWRFTFVWLGFAATLMLVLSSMELSTFHLLYSNFESLSWWRYLSPWDLQLQIQESYYSILVLGLCWMYFEKLSLTTGCFYHLMLFESSPLASM